MSIAMQRSVKSGCCRSVPACSSGRGPRVGRVVHVQPGRLAPHRLSSQLIARATEEATAAEADALTAEGPPESPSAEVAAEAAAEAEEQAALGPVERVRKALDGENVDRSILAAAVSELEAELGQLQDAAAAAEARSSSLEAAAALSKDQLIRLNADFENFRRRTREDKDRLADSLRGDIVTSLLPVVDNFELARTQVKAETEGEQKIHNSYQGLYRQFVEFLRGLGVEAVPSVGSLFDPNIHEAIMKEPNEEVADNTVLQEFRKGFKIGDKLLRPAMVKVSVNDGVPPAAAPPAQPAADEQ